jgi:hypothetical protein
MMKFVDIAYSCIWVVPEATTIISGQLQIYKLQLQIYKLHIYKLQLDRNKKY